MKNSHSDPLGGNIYRQKKVVVARHIHSRCLQCHLPHPQRQTQPQRGIVLFIYPFLYVLFVLALKAFDRNSQITL